MAWKRSTVRTRPGPPQRFHRLSTTFPPAATVRFGVQLESKPLFSMGTVKVCFGCPRCDQCSETVARIGRRGHLFDVCCLLETTTMRFPYKDVPGCLQIGNADLIGVRTLT
jgi:hypothetical protein